MKTKSKKEAPLTILSEKTYTVKIETRSDGKTRMTRHNDGFNPLELLGLLERIQQEILQQMSGAMPQPDIVERTITDPKK